MTAMELPRADIDPDGLLEYSVVFTDRSLNHMSARFVADLQELISILKSTYHAESVAVVWERPGDAALTKKDAGWIGRLHGTGAPVRAQLISGDDGVRLVDPSAVPAA